MRKKIEIGRRNFIKNAALGIAGAAVPARAAGARSSAQAAQPTENTPPKIKEYRVLGRTGFEVSDLATGHIQDFGVFSAMLDAGVNCIDTGESYPGAHKLIGRVLKGRDRKKFFLTSKMQPEGDITREGFLKRARKCLEEPGARAELCGSCPGLCEKACPYGVPIQGMLLLAHDQLMLA